MNTFDPRNEGDGEESWRISLLLCFICLIFYEEKRIDIKGKGEIKSNG